jgi:hypothetical protein
MRTKTLLIAAAALAATVISSEAQVYSANVVGYINETLPAHGFAFMGNQLVNGSDANKTNNNIQAVLTTGLVSDPNGLNNTTFYFWNGSGYNVFSYYIAVDADNQFGQDFGNGWYDGGGNLANVSLNQGAGGGHFLFNPSGTALTNITIVGTVMQATNVYVVHQGFNTYTLPEPVSTNIDSALVNFPGTSDPNGINNDVYYHFNGSGYNVLTYYTAADADNQFGQDFGNGWYDGNGNLGTAAVWPQVGQAFWIHHVVAPTESWTNVFSVK